MEEGADGDCHLVPTHRHILSGLPHFALLFRVVLCLSGKVKRY
jgi:hypothetical protein